MSEEALCCAEMVSPLTNVSVLQAEMKAWCSRLLTGGSQRHAKPLVPVCSRFLFWPLRFLSFGTPFLPARLSSGAAPSPWNLTLTRTPSSAFACLPNPLMISCVP